MTTEQFAEVIKGQQAIIDRLDKMDLNGYADILREVAREKQTRRAMWAALATPRSVAVKLSWVIVGAIIWAITNHWAAFWPTRVHP